MGLVLQTVGSHYMLARSVTFRSLLALLVAMWTPICLCAVGTDGAGHDHAAEQVKPHGHDHDSDDDSDDHDGCPGHDHNGSRCDCSQQSAALAKVDQTLKDSVVIAAMVVLPGWSQWPEPVGVVVGCTRPFGTVPRPPTSLLRMHCALTV